MPRIVTNRRSAPGFSGKMQMLLGVAPRASTRMQMLSEKAATHRPQIQISRDVSVTGTGSMFFRIGPAVHALDLPSRPH
jgi:hypothetical protein